MKELDAIDETLLHFFNRVSDTCEALLPMIKEAVTAARVAERAYIIRKLSSVEDFWSPGAAKYVQELPDEPPKAT